MISIKINDVNNFMQKLLTDDIFDTFLVTEGEICTSNTFTINGHINRNFYNSDELNLINEEFILWKQSKHICFEIIRGKKVPTRMRLIFALPKNGYNKIIADCGMNIAKDNINGLYIHILYENSELSVITGTSINIFTLDKTLDKYWDQLITQFLSKNFDIKEI